MTKEEIKMNEKLYQAEIKAGFLFEACVNCDNYIKYHKTDSDQTIGEEFELHEAICNARYD